MASGPTDIEPSQNRNPYIIVLIDGDGLLVSSSVAIHFVCKLTGCSLRKT
jgi:hypothetical protein